jgi:hypothetical protein
MENPRPAVPGGSMDSTQKAQIEQEIRVQIVRRMRARLGFIWHAVVFFMANITMIFINLRFSPDTWWFVWPLGGWGAGLILHAFAVFGGPALSEAAIQAEVQREMARRGYV